MNKICFITYHNWITKRHGGFHRLAQATAECGIETVFFSFARPYYIRWKNEDRLNKNVLKSLTKGLTYDVGVGKLFNITFPTLALPNIFRKWVPYSINKWLMTHSLTSFSKFAKHYLEGTECFVFESCEAVLLVDEIKRAFQKAKIIYRPSDPLWEFSNDFYAERGEEQMLKLADRVLTVNEESIEGYRFKFPKLFNKSKFICLPNGVDVSEYKKQYEIPELLEDQTTACYIGSFLPDWNLLEKTVQVLPEIRFVIITPHSLDQEAKRIVDSNDNLFYIDGIPPRDVPKWITNCNVVIQPFCKEYGHKDKLSLGLTAKNYKAMAANKPIVGFEIPMSLSRYGLITTETVEAFIDGIRLAITQTPKVYDFDIESRNWTKICEDFLKICCE